MRRIRLILHLISNDKEALKLPEVELAETVKDKVRDFLKELNIDVEVFFVSNWGKYIIVEKVEEP